MDGEAVGDMVGAFPVLEEPDVGAVAANSYEVLTGLEKERRLVKALWAMKQLQHIHDGSCR